jgi:hypothetical protein
MLTAACLVLLVQHDYENTGWQTWVQQASISTTQDRVSSQKPCVGENQVIDINV